MSCRNENPGGQTTNPDGQTGEMTNQRGLEGQHEYTKMGEPSDEAALAINMAMMPLIDAGLVIPSQPGLEGQQEYTVVEQSAEATLEVNKALKALVDAGHLILDDDECFATAEQEPAAAAAATEDGRSQAGEGEAPGSMDRTPDTPAFPGSARLPVAQCTLVPCLRGSDRCRGFVPSTRTRWARRITLEDLPLS
jgi:hypothetical protein